MDLEKTIRALKGRGFAVSRFAAKEEAADYLAGEVKGMSVGLGGSMTLKEIGVEDRLKENNTVYWHWTATADPQEALRQAMTTDVYLLSANAIAEDTGEILNIDGTGNRVSSSLFGHKKVYFVAGKNKISPNYESALFRLRNVVSPKNAQRLGRKTPCALNADKCYNCDSPERICKALVVFFQKIGSMDVEVILIDEDLGY